MKQIFTLLTAFLLLLTGCAGPAEAEQGLKVTVERSDIYSISCATQYDTCVGQNADNSPLDPGDCLYFSPSIGKVHYTVFVKDTAGSTVAVGEFTDDFSGGLVELVVTQDGRITRG